MHRLGPEAVDAFGRQLLQETRAIVRCHLLDDRLKLLIVERLDQAPLHIERQIANFIEAETPRARRLRSSSPLMWLAR